MKKILCINVASNRPNCDCIWHIMSVVSLQTAAGVRWIPLSLRAGQTRGMAQNQDTLFFTWVTLSYPEHMQPTGEHQG